MAGMDRNQVTTERKEVMRQSSGTNKTLIVIAAALAVMVVATAGIILGLYLRDKDDKTADSESVSALEADIEKQQDTDTDKTNRNQGADDTMIEDTMPDSDNTASDKDIFERYLNEVLVPKYGWFQSPQEGTVHGDSMGNPVDSDWLNPAGILSTYIYDFDNDQDKEMLVIAAGDISESGTETDDGKCRLFFEIYEDDKGNVQLSDAMPFSPNKDNVAIEWDYETLYKNEWREFCYSAGIANVNGDIVIVCENHDRASAFGEGCNQNYWALTYRNGSLDYSYGFIQTNGGSSDFVFEGCEYSDGQCNNPEICYSEDGEGESMAAGEYSGKNFSEALALFFKNHGINIAADGPEYAWENTMKSIFSTDPDVTMVFDLKNECTDSDYESGSFQYRITNFSNNIGG